MMLKVQYTFASEETIVEYAFNTELALSSNTVVETLISAFLFGPLIPCHRIHRDTVLTSTHYMQRALKYIYMFSHMPLYMAELQVKWNDV